MSATMKTVQVRCPSGTLTPRVCFAAAAPPAGGTLRGTHAEVCNVHRVWRVRRTVRSAWRMCASRSDANTEAPSIADDEATRRVDDTGVFYLRLSGVLLASAAVIPTICSVFGNADSVARPIDYSTHYTMLALVIGFAVAHSGLASLRSRVAALIGERAYRILFALVSLPGAVGTIAYFIAHRYDGAQLWQLQGVAGIHTTCYILTFISFLLLYPATFNLAEVAAINRPQQRIYETGIMRITRHPQLWGQILWCAAHGAWIGTSLTAVASLALVAHHSFAVWNGDRRLRDKYGSTWQDFGARTSVFPFRALVDGRQRLDLREFPLRAYAGVVVFVLATYAAHPAMLRAVGSLSL